MARARSDRKKKVAADVWRQLLDFIVETANQRVQVIASYQLTPNDSRALFTLAEGGEQTMGSLAKAWGCDASNATWVVDRLESRGLIERRGVPGDRRVKLVALTPLGVKTMAALRRKLYVPPPELLELGRADLEALREASARLRKREPTPSRTTKARRGSG
jgi:DNA-binding MarR family transcriptional regulator